MPALVDGASSLTYIPFHRELDGFHGLRCYPDNILLAFPVPSPIFPWVVTIRMNVVQIAVVVEEFCYAIANIRPPVALNLAIILADHLTFRGFLFRTFDPVVESVAIGSCFR